jgi:Reverse transcriptase (RNA-dependent DNA polymerase)
MEKMANKRLSWFLESNDHIAIEQFGFRRGKSTNDCLITLESEIQTAFHNKQHLVAVSFDIEKAYDTAWRYGNIRKIFKF